ncbi:MAG: hypothetical protein HFI33_15425 [Lachnospiraceae bacterium]|nr:hypothetical protein [Lachnospiraceae bacterium]
MGLRMMTPKRLRKAKSKNSKEILRRLEEYLESAAVTGEPVEILCGFWGDQQDAITYQELRQIVQEGMVDQETLQLWEQDYSVLVAGQLGRLWRNAVIAGLAGQPLLDSRRFVFNTQTSGILNWIRNRGAEFVTASTQEQKNAISALLTKKMRDGHTVDELSRLIRPCIGLTEGDTKAAVRLYDSIVANLKKEHPRMKPETIRRRALDATQKYAERKHQARAMTIAQTESAFAYNRGADEGIRQAQAAGYLGTVKKRWCTSGDDSVCAMCNSLDGVEVAMDAEFGMKGKILFPGYRLMPPAHPRCACAVEYIEVSPPVTIPQMEVSVTQAGSFREYTTEEIESIARQTEESASRHVSVPSKWSGKIVIDDELGKTGKLWICDILATHLTAPHMILHEQLHARSISHYGDAKFYENRNIEEAAVQFMTQEISIKEGIEVIESLYDEMTDALRELRKRTSLYPTDYDFAKALLEMPVDYRLDWLSEAVYSKMRMRADVTVKEYMEISDLLDMLYTKEV